MQGVSRPKLSIVDVLALTTVAVIGLAVVALILGALVVGIDGLWGGVQG